MKILIDGTIYNEIAWHEIQCREGALRIRWSGDSASRVDGGFAQEHDIIEAALESFEREKVFKPQTVLFRAAIKTLTAIIDEVFAGVRCHVAPGVDATRIECSVSSEAANRVHSLILNRVGGQRRPLVIFELRSGAAWWRLDVEEGCDVSSLLAGGPFPALDVRADGAFSPSLGDDPPSREEMTTAIEQVREAVDAALVCRECEIIEENAKSDEESQP